MLTKEEVQHIAKLARIQLTEEEICVFQQELTQVLEYFDTIQHADLSGIDSAALMPINIEREDLPKREAPETIEQLIAMAPDTKDGNIKVRSIL